MNLLGADYNIIARQCMEGFGPLGGKCNGGRGTYSTGIVVPGQGGKSVQAKMCLFVVLICLFIVLLFVSIVSIYFLY